ncbi:MAG: hypothetical protein AB7F75_03065 [Planctomycetota bacterium]
MKNLFTLLALATLTLNPLTLGAEPDTQADREAVKQKAKEKAAKKKAEAEKRKAELEAKKEALKKKAEERIEERQENQDKRIEHGIEKGYLTAEEAAKLKADQDAFAAKADGLKSDGALTKEEFHDLKTDLNEMSHDIWIQKHDTDGNQMPVYKISKNAKLKASVAERLESGEISGEEAKKFYQDMRRIKELQKVLRSEETGDEERAKAQSKYNELVGLYFNIGEE